MKKKMLSMMLAAAMTVSCGAYSVGAEAVADGSVNEYGLTAAQQETLLQSVKTSVTEGYLEKYGLTPEEFEIRPYDVNEFNYYDSSWTYTGEDPYEFTRIWYTIDDMLGNKAGLNIGALMDYSTLNFGGYVSTMLEDDYKFADTLKEQCEQNLQYTGEAPAFYSETEEYYDLANSIYTGIAQFLNGLEAQERAELVYSLYYNLYMEGTSENVVINDVGYPPRTMFDRVISENVQFY